jgi:DNA primase
MSQVDQVRAAADIVKITGDYVKLRKSGANFVGLCPFHHEKTPSFAVHPTKQIFHCFGCGVGGDVFKFVMMIENLSFPEALRRVAEKVGIVLREREGGEGTDERARERTALFKLHEAAAKFYSAQLGATAEGRAARGYLADRGLDDATVARFRLGYAPANGQALTQYLEDLGFRAEISEKSGLVLRGEEGKRRFDRFRRRIIFPISNESAKVVAFGGRALGDDQPKYLNSPETPIYTKGRVLFHLDGAGSGIRKLDYAILVEGYMDSIAVASAGIDNVVASCGTSLSEGQIRLLARYTRRVIVNYDPDSAGVAATERSLDLLLEEGFEAKVLALPGGLDPDSFIRKRGAAEYKERLSAAPSYLDYLTERAAARHDLGRPEGKVAAANAVMPYLARVPNAMLRAELANRLAERLKLDGKLLQEELRRSARSRSEPSQTSGAATGVRVDAASIKATPAERKLLRAFFESPAMVEEFLPKLVEGGFAEGLATEATLRRLLELHRTGEKLDLTRVEEWLDESGQRIVYDCAMETGETPDLALVRACVQSLEVRKADRTRENLQSAIQAAEREGDKARLSQLLEDKTKLIKEMERLRKAV